MKNGYLYANEAPGWGIEIDEKAAAKYPFGSGEGGERKPETFEREGHAFVRLLSQTSERKTARNAMPTETRISRYACASAPVCTSL